MKSHQPLFEVCGSIFTHQVPEGLVKNDDGQERAGSQSDPWVVETEFELVHSHIFPASNHLFSFITIDPDSGGWLAINR